MTLPDVEFLTVADVARTLRVSKMTVHRLIRDGKLTAYRFGRSFRIDPRDLMDYMRASVAVTGGES